MSPGNFLDEFGLAQPLVVGAEFVLDHGSERVHLAGNAADRRDFGNKVHEGQEGSAPRLDKHDAAVCSKCTLHFRKSLVEIVRQSGQMMQAALDDEDVLAAIGEGKPPAIGDRALRRAFELRKQPGGQVHTFEPGEAEPLQGD